VKCKEVVSSENTI